MNVKDSSFVLIKNVSTDFNHSIEELKKLLRSIERCMIVYYDNIVRSRRQNVRIIHKYCQVPNHRLVCLGKVSNGVGIGDILVILDLPRYNFCFVRRVVFQVSSAFVVEEVGFHPVRSGSPVTT